MDSRLFVGTAAMSGRYAMSCVGFETGSHRFTFSNGKSLLEVKSVSEATWTRYTGPRGGRGWKNAQTGVVAYQDESPGKVGLKSQPSQSPKLESSKKPIITQLDGIKAEAIKAGSFDEFRKDFQRQIKHGLYWHVTDDQDFQIDPEKGPRDMSSMSAGGIDKGRLMVTSHLENWDDYYNIDPGTDERDVKRPYAALIDMREVPRNGYYQVSRGFGNEFFVPDPSQAKVSAVMPIDKAREYDEQQHATLPRSEDELRKIYDEAVADNVSRSGAKQSASTVYHATRVTGDRKEASSLGKWVTRSETAARHFAGGDDYKTELLPSGKYLTLKSTEFENDDAITRQEINRQLKESGVSFQFDEDTYEDDEEYEAWRWMDYGGKPLVASVKKAGFAGIEMTERVGRTLSQSVLLFPGKKPATIKETFTFIRRNGVVAVESTSTCGADTGTGGHGFGIGNDCARDGGVSRQPAGSTTRDFKSWFGDSVVTDRHGDPLVLYHGTRHADLESFDPEKLGSYTGAASATKAFFFSDDPEVASTYPDGLHEVNRADGMTMPGFMGTPSSMEYRLPQAERDAEIAREASYEVVDAEDGEGFEVHITELDNYGSPFTYDDGFIYENRIEADDAGNEAVDKIIADADAKVEKYQQKSEEERINAMQGGGVLPIYLRMENPLEYDFAGSDYREISFSELIDEAIEYGHDGVIFTNVNDAALGDIHSTIYAVFDPGQIKIASGNSGKFSRQSRRIKEDAEFAKQDHLRKVSEKLYAARALQGSNVGVRLDIPSAKRGLEVVTIHESPSGGTVVGYDHSAVIENATFVVQTSGIRKVGAEGGNKFPFAYIAGTLTDYRKLGSSTTELFFDPRRVHLFVDGRNHAVESADRVALIGKRMYAEGVKYYEVVPPAPAGMRSQVVEHGHHDQKTHGNRDSRPSDKAPIRKQTDTPQFKEWFGDSKVVDEDGQPLVVYHGTRDGFTEFDDSKSLHFSGDPGISGLYASGVGGGRPTLDARIMPVFLRMENPLDIRDMDMDELYELTGYPFDGDDLHDPEKLQELKEDYLWEYDGIIANHESSMGREDGTIEYIVFDRSQIKSATGNRGTFDPKSRNINESAGSFDETELPEVDDDDIDVTDYGIKRSVAESGRWDRHTKKGNWGAGGASGLIVVAADTGRVLVDKRSAHVSGGAGALGTFGGAIPGPHLNPLESAVTELREEAGYDGEFLSVAPAFRYVDNTDLLDDGEPWFYQNFIAVVPNEFEPKAPDESAWETDGGEWFDLHDLEKEGNVHPGLSALLRESKSELRKIVKGSKCGANKKGGGGFTKGNTCAAGRVEKPTETKAFKNWLGKSQIVNDDGSPTVMYHGTARSGFTEFKTDNPSDKVNRRDLISVTPDPAFAGMYAGKTVGGEYNSGGGIYAVYVSAENIADFRNPEHVKLLTQFRTDKHEEFLRTKANRVAWKVETEEALQQNLKNFYDEELVKVSKGHWMHWEWKDFLVKNGFDGAWTTEGEFSDYPDTVNLAVLDSSQIKSAISNSGEYSRKSKHITEAAKVQWTRYTGPRGGRGWRNQQTGRVAYQEESPGKVGVKSSPQKPPAASAKVPDGPQSRAGLYKSEDEFVQAESMRRYLESVGVNVNDDNTVTLWHAAHSPEDVEKIKTEGFFKGGANAPGGMTGLKLAPSAFFGSDKDWVAKTWGGKSGNLIQVKVPVEQYRHGAEHPIEAYFENGLRRGDDGIWRAETLRDTFVNKLAVLDFSDGLSDAYNRGKPSVNRTDKLKSWFGDSKVVDESGNPLVVYHGTANAGFSEFDDNPSARNTENQLSHLGIWFTSDTNTANSFTGDGDKSGAVMPVYLSIKNPKVYTRVSEGEKNAKIEGIEKSLGELEAKYSATIRSAMFSMSELSPDQQEQRMEYRAEKERLQEEMLLAKNDDPLESLMDDRDEFATWINGKKGVRGAWRDRYVEVGNVRETSLKLRDNLIKQGYDGIILKGTVYDANGKKTDQYVVFDPKQIKSATGNRGTFDPRNPNIHESYRFVRRNGCIAVEKEACGANAQGGGGFQPGNTCATGGGTWQSDNNPNKKHPDVANKLDADKWNLSATAEAFIAARDKSDKKGFLSPVAPGDLVNHKLFLSHDGTVGVAVSPEGDIQNLFNNGGPKGAGGEAILLAIKHGGNTLDCYDGFLPTIYKLYGFEETNRMKFNREYAPQGWDFDTYGDPDVVFMARTNNLSEQEMRDNAGKPKDQRTAPEKSNDYTDDWDGAKERSRAAAREVEKRRKNRAAGQPLDRAGGDVWRSVESAPLRFQFGNSRGVVAWRSELGNISPMNTFTAVAESCLRDTDGQFAVGNDCAATDFSATASDRSESTQDHHQIAIRPEVLSDITSEEVLGSGKNQSIKLTYRVNGETKQGVFKPTSGERAMGMRAYPYGTQASREVAVSLIDDAMGLGMVPKTIYAEKPSGESLESLQDQKREAKAEWDRLIDHIDDDPEATNIPNWGELKTSAKERAAMERYLEISSRIDTLTTGPGSLQEWVQGGTTANKILDKFSTETIAPDAFNDVSRLGDMLFFDILIGNDDRHYSNWMVKDGDVRLIDNGRSLGENHAYYKRRLEDEQLPYNRTLEAHPQLRGMQRMSDEFRDGLLRILDNRQSLSKQLRKTGITDAEIDSFWKRAEYIIKSPMLAFGASSLEDIASLSEEGKAPWDR